MGICGFGLFIGRSEFLASKLHSHWSWSVGPRTTEEEKTNNRYIYLDSGLQYSSYMAVLLLSDTITRKEATGLVAHLQLVLQLSQALGSQ